MIITILQGGLGNQIFQYACARALAERHCTEVAVDLCLLGKENNITTKRSYYLDSYNLDLKTCRHAELSSVLGVSQNKLKAQLINFTHKYLNYPKYLYYKEAGFGFDDKLHFLPNGIIIDGYWQSEKYFKSIAAILRQELIPKPELLSNVKQLIELIKVSPSISLHVRRGDYVSNPHANKIHGPCSLEYYEKAVKEIGESVEDPYFFVFSDDIVWAKKNIKIGAGKIHFIEDNLGSPAVDLYLMSLCKHNIIANSSFSWWGAWLNNNSKKIVIAPKQWFADTKLNGQTIDLVPHEWKRV